MAKDKRKDKDKQSVDGLGVSFEQAMNIFAQPKPTDEELIIAGIKNIQDQYPRFFRGKKTIWEFIAIVHNNPIGVRETPLYDSLPNEIKHQIEQTFRFY